MREQKIKDILHDTVRGMKCEEYS